MSSTVIYGRLRSKINYQGTCRVETMVRIGPLLSGGVKGDSKREATKKRRTREKISCARAPPSKRRPQRWMSEDERYVVISWLVSLVCDSLGGLSTSPICGYFCKLPWLQRPQTWDAQRVVGVCAPVCVCVCVPKRPCTGTSQQTTWRSCTSCDFRPKTLNSESDGDMKKKKAVMTWNQFSSLTSLGRTAELVIRSTSLLQPSSDSSFAFFLVFVLG